MSSASVPPHGFVTVRGRGYRPEQVDAYTQALSRDRDAAWERAARLTVLARDMEAELRRVREAVAGLAPQDYASLGESARRLFQLVLDEAAEVRERARSAARAELAHAEARASDVRRAAQEAADALHAEAEEHARLCFLAARTEADEIRVGTRLGLKEFRAEALAALREIRQRTSALLVEQGREQAARWAEVERVEAEQVAAFEADHAERLARAEAALAEARQALGDAEESARRWQEEARARAAEILAEARLREDRIARETEDLLREHGETWDVVQAHMDHVRSRLSALTGRATAE
ncbi:cellulose-binding protein [Streptomyces sp. NPDC006739]|uniref:cellulose-binding protein n=1 Tax=Streptomyces sp. NPDC006739 TaxID=3364763 RepID=UPI0036C954DE